MFLIYIESIIKIRLNKTRLELSGAEDLRLGCLLASSEGLSRAPDCFLDV
jgi:hypothetical protein